MSRMRKGTHEMAEPVAAADPEPEAVAGLDVDASDSDSDAHLQSEKSIRRRARKAKKAAKEKATATSFRKDKAAATAAPTYDTAAASTSTSKPTATALPQPAAAAAVPTKAAATAHHHPLPPPRRGPVHTIGMVGHPNAGKSSVINCLCSEKRVSVSRTAGHTKRAQTVPLTEGVDLLDCPGLAFPHAIGDPAATAASTATTGSVVGLEDERAMQELLGVIPIAQVREPYTAVRYLLERLPLDRLYGLQLPKDEPSWNPMLFCEVLAHKRGLHIARTGRPDSHAAGRAVLYDSQDGVIPIAWWPPGYTPPPTPASGASGK